jgi:transposase
MKKKKLELTKEDISILDGMVKNSNSYFIRRKTQSLLLLHEGKMIKELVKIFKVNRNTLGGWRKEWEQNKKIAMKKGRGRKEKLSQEIQMEIHTLVKQYPNNIKRVHQEVMDKNNIRFSRELLRKIIKKNSNLKEQRE